MNDLKENIADLT